MRYPFPQDRTLTEARAAAGSPVTVAGNLTVTFYTDAACTILADLQTPDGTPVTGSTLTFTGQMTEFLGPDDVTVLYAQVTGADPWRVDAQFWAQIASIVSGTGSQGATGETGAPGKSAYDVAVDTGFTGSKTAWLASLVGPAGAPGVKGDPGTPGSPGSPGTAATITVGTVTNLPAGSSPTVVNSGTPTAAVFDLGLVRGADGKDGKDGSAGVKGDPGVKGDAGSPGTAATITVGTVTNLPAGSSPTVVNSGTPTAAVFDLGLVRGADGKDGKDGSAGVKGDPGTPGITPAISVAATTLAAGAAATVVKTGTDAAPTFTFGIPKGADGAAGSGGSGSGETNSMYRNANIKIASFPPQMLDGNTAAGSWVSTQTGGHLCVTVAAGANATATKFAFLWSSVDPATTTAQVLVYDQRTKAVLATGTPLLATDTHQIVTLSAPVTLVAGSEYVLSIWMSTTGNIPAIACHAPVPGNPVRAYRTPGGSFIAFGAASPSTPASALPTPGYYLDAMPYMALI